MPAEVGSTTEIVMPRLSDSMDEGTIVKWLKSVGDAVTIGDELVEIETDKANMVYEADLAGTLIEIVAAEGATLAIGEPIARVGDGRAGAPGSVPAVGTDNAPVDGRGKASPVARRIAADHGIDLAEVTGSGTSGRILKADVEAKLAGHTSPPNIGPPGVPGRPETTKGQTEVVELTKLQQTVARRMSESKATAPHFYLQAEIDMTAAVSGRNALKASAAEGERVPTFNDMVVKACALALREFPRANGAYRDGKIEHYSRINVGVAVAGQDTLVVPTVFDADLKGLRQISAETRALASRVRDESITPPELSGGTFTVSNLGMYGISNFHAVINTPQAGILAVGELKAKAAVVDGEVVARDLMGVTLACDHRILYGADGAAFLRRVRKLLEQPIGLAL